MLLDFRALRRASQSSRARLIGHPSVAAAPDLVEYDAHDTKPANVVGAVSTRFFQCGNVGIARLCGYPIGGSIANQLKPVLLFQGDEIRGPRRPVGLDQAEYPSARTVPTAAMPAAFDRKRRRDAAST
jgi:hypothetical protein